MSLTQERVRELFTYDDQGFLIWKKDKGSAKAGAIAGCAFADPSGKTRHGIKVDKRLYYAYRLIFLYHHGYLPQSIDHIDRIPSNNRIENLRPATAAEQKGNIAVQKNNTSGYRGVGWRARHKKWEARIRVRGVLRVLGYFHKVENAARAYNAAAKEVWGEFAFQNEVKGPHEGARRRGVKGTVHVVETGETFASVQECAAAYGLTRALMLYYLRAGTAHKRLGVTFRRTGASTSD